MKCMHSFRRLSLFAASLSFLAVLASGQENPPPKVLPSIVTLSVLKADGTTQTGVGFLTIRDGVAAAAWHIVKDAKRVVARFPSGRRI